MYLCSHVLLWIIYKEEIIMSKEQVLEDISSLIQDIDKWINVYKDAMSKEDKLRIAGAQSVLNTYLTAAHQELSFLHNYIGGLWKDAQGDELPEYDREVVVFTQDFPNDAGIMAVAIGHRPNPEGWDGKSLSTGKVEHYTPQCYDKGGWNISSVKYWLDLDLPGEGGSNEQED